MGKRKLAVAASVWFVTSNGMVGDWRVPADVIGTEPDAVVAAVRFEVAEKVY